MRRTRSSKYRLPVTSETMNALEQDLFVKLRHISPPPLSPDIGYRNTEKRNIRDSPRVSFNAQSNKHTPIR